MGLELWPQLIRNNYELHEWRHATAVLHTDFPAEFADIVDVLTDFRLLRSHIALGGKNKSKVSGSIDDQFYRRGWAEKQFDTRIVVDGRESKSPTHKVDCFRNHVAFEIEWNNKDPFFDRDLNNFRLLFELRTVSVGVILTRCDELQDIFDELGRGDSYGNSTTHMSKLLPRVQGGGGGGCPILVFGIKRSLYVKDRIPTAEELADAAAEERRLAKEARDAEAAKRKAARKAAAALAREQREAELRAERERKAAERHALREATQAAAPKR